MIFKKRIEHFQPSRLARYRFLEQYGNAHPINLLCELAGLIIHIDGGGQYGLKASRKNLTGLGFLQSMTRKENHYDNAQAESLFSRFKAELLEDGVFLDVEDARQESFDYIEG